MGVGEIEAWGEALGVGEGEVFGGNLVIFTSDSFSASRGSIFAFFESEGMGSISRAMCNPKEINSIGRNKIRTGLGKFLRKNGGFMVALRAI